MRYYLLFAFIWLITLPPLRILYFISDLLFLLIYYVFRYRRNVVIENLSRVFPEKSHSEKEKIAKGFYRHFSDYIIESFKLIHFSEADLNRHFTYENIHLINDLMDEGRSLILVSGHINNWEWMVNIQSQLRHKYLAIYKPLADKNFDRLVKYLRSKYARDGELVTMNNVFKRLLELRNENVKNITWFLADQSPPGGYPVRKKFFDVEIPVYSGPAKLAKRFNYAIVYLEIKKQSRGFYLANFRLLNEAPAQFSEDELMEDYLRAIEDSIKKQPEYWLWSHRRWKHSR